MKAMKPDLSPWKVLAGLALLAVVAALAVWNDNRSDDDDDDGTDDMNAPSPVGPETIAHLAPTWELLCPSEGWGTTCIQHNLVTGETRYVTPPEGNP